VEVGEWESEDVGEKGNGWCNGIDALLLDSLRPAFFSDRRCARWGALQACKQMRRSVVVVYIKFGREIK
jgi:hypothetical protein